MCTLQYVRLHSAGIVSYNTKHEKKNVIEFGERGSPDEDGTFLPLRRKVAPPLLKAGSALVRFRYGDTIIKESELAKFADKQTGEFYRYRYGFDVHQPLNANGEVDQSSGQSSSGVLSVIDKTREGATKIARWFTKRFDAFGSYDFESWNCENFATFCHTTSLDEQQLEEEYLKRKTSGEIATFPEFLRQNSTPVSLQVERFRGSGIYYHDDDMDSVIMNANACGVDECDGEPAAQARCVGVGEEEGVTQQTPVGQDEDEEGEEEEDNEEEVDDEEEEDGKTDVTSPDEDEDQDEETYGEQKNDEEARKEEEAEGDSGYNEEESLLQSNGKKATIPTGQPLQGQGLAEQQAGEDVADTSIGDTIESMIDRSEPGFPPNSVKQAHSDDENDEATLAPRKRVKVSE